MDETEFVERRHHERYQAEKGAFVAVRGPIRKLWQILDISKGGVAFRYVANGEEWERSSELDILTADTRFSLETVPFKCISDCAVINEISSGFKRRRGGVQFEKLTKFQMSQLELFIRDYTTSLG